MALDKDAQLRHLRAQVAALTRWSKEDPQATAGKLRRGLRLRWEADVDKAAAAAGETLTPAERQRRAIAAQKAHLKRIAMISVVRRRARRLAAGDPVAEG